MIENWLRSSFDMHIHAGQICALENVVELAEEESKHAIRGFDDKSPHVPTYIQARYLERLIRTKRYF